MHPEAMEFCQSTLEAIPTNFSGNALDIGGYNVNGSARELWPHAHWTIIDPKFVDADVKWFERTIISANAEEWTPDKEYGLVLCTEVLEHTPNWTLIINVAHKALVKDGSFIITCAATGRMPHSVDGDGLPKGGEYYKNIRPDELGDMLYMSGFICQVMYNPITSDNYAYAVKS